MNSLTIANSATTGTARGTVTYNPSVTDSGRIAMHSTAGSVSLSPVSKDIKGAVYAYVQAMRTLGHMHVRSEQVSRALGISSSAAMAALQALEGKGVRRSK